MKEKYNFKRVHRLNGIIMVITFLYLSVKAVITTENSGDVGIAIVGVIPILLIACFIYFIKWPDIIKALLFGFIPMITSVGMLTVYGYSIERHLIVIITIGVHAKITDSLVR